MTVAPSLAAPRGFALQLVPQVGYVPARREHVRIADPAAGAVWTYVVPAGSVELLLSVVETLTTSAAVANRLPTLRIQDADQNEVAAIPQAAVVPASTPSRCWFGYGAAPVAPASLAVLAAPLPWIVLEPGWRVVATVSAIDAGDQLSVIRLVTLRLPQRVAVEEPRAAGGTLT